MNPSEICRFASVLWEPDDIIEIRRLPSERCTWHRARDISPIGDTLAADNSAGENIYAGVNPRTAAGRKGDKHVAVARCLAADFDHVEPDLAAAAIVTAGMPEPSLIVNSGHGTHAYWKLAVAIAPLIWRTWQQDLAALLGSDSVIHNPERILRLPGFMNVKAAPVPCRIVSIGPTRIYDLADLPIPTRSGSDTPAPVFTVRERRSSDTIGAFDRCRAYLTKCPPAVAGNRGHRATWYAANICNRFGLSREEATDLMRWYSITKCDPPWTERGIAHKVADSYARNSHEHGTKLHETRVFAIRQKCGAA